MRSMARARDFLLSRPRISAGSRTLSRNRAPFQQHGFLKDDADIARGMEERGAVEEKLAATGADERTDELSRVDLPQPDGPTRVTNSFCLIESVTSASAATRPLRDA